MPSFVPLLRILSGFRAGAAAGFEWGMLQGAVKTLAALDGQAAGTRGLHDQVQRSRDWGGCKCWRYTYKPIYNLLTNLRLAHPQIQVLQTAIDVPPRGAMLALYRHILSSPPPPQQPDTATVQAPLFQLEAQGLGSQTEVQDGPHHPLSEAPLLEDRRANDPRGTQGQDAAALLADAFTAALSPISTRMAGTAPGAATLGGEEAAKAIEVSTSGRSAAGLWGSTEGSPGAPSGNMGRGIAPGDEAPVPLPAAEAPAVSPSEAVSISTAGLPPDAALLGLPDLPRIMADVRSRLVGLGIELGGVPYPSDAAV
ncbi:hypothetical protein Vafri_17153 [Volvox africanus]|uniref:Uncharacterized protein n=1 Tax=Volvox africanus TaxID=51714 RepID=A0A8J4BKD3_9CHLO|nr:hypothetical protein Vafri_17153 [Volvox africanus]